MNMSQHSDKLRDSLLRAAAMGDETARQVADRLVEAVEPAIQLEALAMAAELADEVNGLSNSVHVDVVMTPEGAALRVATVEAAEPEPETWVDEPENDETVRITLRIPKGLKRQVDSFAQAAGKSLNSWIVAAMRMGVMQERRNERTSPRYTANTLRGWVK